MKKGRFSLIVASVFMLLGVVLSILGVLGGTGLLEGGIASFVSALGAEAGLSGSGFSLLEAGIFCLVEGGVILLFRLRKPFSMPLTLFLLIEYLTLQAAVRRAHSVPLPSYALTILTTTKPGLLFALFVLEVLLSSVLLASVSTLDAKWRKKREIQLKMLEKEGAVKSRETLEEEKLLKRQRKLNEKEERERARDEKKYSLELEKKEKAEKRKREKEEEKERKEYEKKREKEELRRDRKREKEEKKKDRESDRLLEKKEKEEERLESGRLKEEKRRLKEEKKQQKIDEREKKREEEEKLPEINLSEGIGNPDTPLSFPSFEEMPELKTIGHHTYGTNEKTLQSEKEKPLVESSSFMDNLKSEIEREEWDSAADDSAPAPSKLNTRHFTGGGMLEATLEMYNSASETETPSTVNRNPIIGLDDTPSPREERRTEGSIAPSNLDPSHPRYKLFENLQNGEHEEIIPQSAVKTETEHIAPSNLDPSHPRYRLFENLQNGVRDSAASPAPSKAENEHIAPSNLDPSHPRYRMFENLQNGSVDTSLPKREEKKTEDEIAPSYIGKDHPRYRLFEALSENNAKSAETTVSYTPGRAFTPSDEGEVKNPYAAASVLTEEKPFAPVFTKKEEEPQTPVTLRPEKEDSDDTLPQTPSLSSDSVEERTSSPVRKPVETVTAPSSPIRESEAEFEPPKNPQVRSITETEDGHRVFETKSDEEVADDFNLIVGVGDLASNRGGLTAIAMRQKTPYNPPEPSLLKDYPRISQEIDPFTQEQGDIIVRTLAEQRISVELSAIIKGPSVTQYELKLAQGMIISKIKAREDEINYALGGKKVRILAPVPGKQAVGIEVPNPSISIVGFKDMIYALRANEKYMSFKVPMILGRTVTGEPIVIDVSKMPHMIIAGTTGSGKSVCINSFINTIIYEKSPRDVRLIMVDPKVVELTIYNGIPHLLTPVITDAKRAIKALDWLVSEMERRYAMLARYGVRNVIGLNEKIMSGSLKGVEKLPYIVLIMDEFADIMTVVGKEMDAAISRIAAKARAAGIHMILATQRPSADVILGTLKSNLPGRIAFAVSSGVNSRVILDEQGAENLLGKGDMLLMDPGAMGLTRIQGAFVSDGEVEKITDYVTSSNSKPEFLEESVFEEESDVDDGDEEFMDDEGDEDLYEMAKKIVYERKSASASYLQRRLKIGYNRAARIVEQMEEDGIVGPANGSKPREILKFE